MIFGTLKPDQNGRHNIIAQLHNSKIHQQQKHHLVPFGETLFLESLPHNFAQWLNGQISDLFPSLFLLSSQPIEEDTFAFKNGLLTPYICYDALFLSHDPMDITVRILSLTIMYGIQVILQSNGLWRATDY